MFDGSVNGLTDKDIGLDLRKEVFEPGLTRVYNDSVKAFIARECSVDSYIDYINGY